MKHLRFLSAACVAFVALTTVSALPALAASKPKITKAKMVDRDGDGLADRVVLTYSRKVRHRADRDGVYPFKVKGYEIRKVLGANGSRKVRINLREDSAAPAEPVIRYNPTKKQPVKDMKGRQARKQRFLDVIPLQLTDNNVSVSVEGPGSVTSVPLGIDCGTSCQGSFDEGSVVALTAVPDVASTAIFSAWGGDCATFAAAPVCVLTIDGSKVVNAAFEAVSSSRHMTVTSSGPGSVLSVPMGIDCGSTCEADFGESAVVVLTAVPDVASNGTFAGWGGDCATFAVAPECVLTMDGDKTVSAVFETAQLPLDVDLLGTGAGSIVSLPAGIDCSLVATLCSALFPAGTLVTLTAVPDLLSGFGGWGGDCSSFGLTLVCTVVMNAARDVTATFNPLI